MNLSVKDLRFSYQRGQEVLKGISFDKSCILKSSVK